MSDKDKSIAELMDMMKADSDDFFGKVPRGTSKPTLTVGQSGRKYWNEPEEADIEEIDKYEWQDIVDAQNAERDKKGFPDQGHPVSGGYKEGDGSITPAEVTPQTEWDEKS